jgi:hypothetical protein
MVTEQTRSKGWFGACLLPFLLALGGCAEQSRPPDFQLQTTQGGNSGVAITIEPFVEEGQVSATYVVVQNNSPHVVVLVGPATFSAVDATGAKLEAISPEDAVVAAGGEKQLAAGLKYMPRSHAAAEFQQINGILPWTPESRKVMCDPVSSSYSWIMCHGGGWVFLPVTVFIAAPTLALSAAFSQAMPDDLNYHRRIESGAFQFDNGLLGVGESAAGYLFFPKGNYEGVSATIIDVVTSQQITANSSQR